MKRSLLGNIIRKLPFAWMLGCGRVRAFLLRITPGLWFTKVGPRAVVYGWPRVQYWGGPIEIGSDSHLGIKCFFLVGPQGRISVGSGVFINDYCYLASLDAIVIEDGVAIGEFVSIRDNDHEFDGHTSTRELGYRSAQITIGKGAWIGRGVMITRGVTIGEGAVIGANSVVTRDVPPHTVAAGAPARVIKNLAEVAPKAEM